jgi:tetratricopeptide (TPR) repeat protein
LSRRVVVVAALALLPLVAEGQVRLPRGVTVRSLEAAAVRDSNDPVVQYDLAMGYWSRARWDDAERTLGVALAIEPRNAQALLALAHLPYARRPKLWEEEERGEVPPEWLPALVQRDRYVRLAFLMDPMVDLTIVGAVAPDEESLLRGGREATELRTAMVGLTTFRHAQYDQAYAWLDKFARLLGEGTERDRVPAFIYLYRGLAAAHLNDLPSAIRDFRRLHALRTADEPSMLDTDPPLNTYILAWLVHRAGDPVEAAALYREALASDLSIWMAHVQLARIHDEREEWIDAIRERRLALEANPEDGSLLLDLAITLSKAGRPAEAEEVLRAARAELPRNFRVPYFQGLVELQLNRPAEAKVAFQTFLAMVPSRYAAEIAEVRGHLNTLP